MEDGLCDRRVEGWARIVQPAVDIYFGLDINVDALQPIIVMVEAAEI